MATLAERLVEAEQALHDLQIGRAVARVRDANGEEITYSIATRSALAAYVQSLRQLIADEAAGTGPITGPLRPFF